jgi:hypothetical protein
MHMVIGFATQQMTSGYLDLAPGRLVFELRDAMPFVLAAALVAGWDRWPAGRSWLVAAAVAFAVAGTLHAVTSVWFGLTWPPEAPVDGVSLSVGVLSVLATLALPFGPLLASVGLWRARSTNRHGSRWLATIAAVGTVAVLVMVTRLLLAIAVLRITYNLQVSEPFPGALMVANLSFTIGAGLIALLGVAALGAAPGRFFVPEGLIAAGAIAAAVAAIVGEGAPLLIQADVISNSWIGWIPLAGYGQLLGLLVVALGFLSARISVPGEN